MTETDSSQKIVSLAGINEEKEKDNSNNTGKIGKKEMNNMRDPERINEILDIIKRRWHNNPDLRLMQLLLNFIDYRDTEDLYYLEDDVLLKRLTDDIYE